MKPHSALEPAAGIGNLIIIVLTVIKEVATGEEQFQ
jgi:hypothetical protein